MEEITRICELLTCGEAIPTGSRRSRRFCCRKCAQKARAKPLSPEQRAAKAAYYRKNRERLLQDMKRRYEESPDRARERAKAWYAANRENVLENHKQRRISDPDFRASDLKRSREWYEEHRDLPEFQKAKQQYSLRTSSLVVERVRLWRMNNAVRYKEYEVKYRARTAEAKRAYSKAARLAEPNRFRLYDQKKRVIRQSAQTVPFSKAQLDARMLYWGNKCWMCGGPFEHVDHVKPLSRKGWHVLANLRPSCGHCNVLKHAKWFGPQELNRFLKN